jgi:hypothetical protein
MRLGQSLRKLDFFFLNYLYDLNSLSPNAPIRRFAAERGANAIVTVNEVTPVMGMVVDPVPSGGMIGKTAIRRKPVECLGAVLC